MEGLDNLPGKLHDVTYDNFLNDSHTIISCVESERPVLRELLAERGLERGSERGSERGPGSS